MLYCRVCFFQLCGHRYKKAVLMALLYVMFFTFVTFPCGQCPGSGVVLDCIGSRSLSFLCQTTIVTYLCLLAVFNHLLN